MKRFSSAILLALVSSSLLFGGGLVTNTNQSAAWARTLTRQASWGTDAVYYNPAGLGLMNKGIHLSLSNQFIFQTQKITNNYTFIDGAPVTYEGSVRAFLFPGVYAVYKMDKLAISAGFNVIGGGGGADFKEGLPSFEIPVASLVPILQGSLAPIDQAIEGLTGNNPGFANVTGYNLSAPFNGTSMYLGVQAGATYAINDIVSVALGARYVTAKNTYEGSLTGVTVDAPAAYGGTQAPGTYVRFVGNQINPLDPATGALLFATADALDAQTADKQVEAVQTGWGITPIAGVNIHLYDVVNIGLKYEHHTKIELENETTVDNVGMFPDGAITRADLPGMFSLGIQLNPINKLTASLGYNMYLDKPAFYGVTDAGGIQINNETTIDNNSYELGLSLEYMLMNSFGLSAGFLMARNGVNDTYQSDLNYALNTNSVAGGFYLGIGDRIGINAGVVYVMFQEYSVGKTYTFTGAPAPVPFTETYNKNTILFAIGLDFKF